MDEPIELSFQFPSWSDADPGDGIAFQIVLKAEAASSEEAVVFRLALIRDADHAGAISHRRAQPDIVYARFAGIKQAGDFARGLLAVVKESGG